MSAENITTSRLRIPWVHNRLVRSVMPAIERTLLVYLEPFATRGEYRLTPVIGWAWCSEWNSHKREHRPSDERREDVEDVLEPLVLLSGEKAGTFVADIAAYMDETVIGLYPASLAETAAGQAAIAEAVEDKWKQWDREEAAEKVKTEL